VQGEISPFAADKLLEVRYGQVQMTYVDMDSTAYSGVIEMTFYGLLTDAYTSLLADIETATKSLASLNVANVTIGAHGAILATMQRPGVVQDQTKSYWEFTVNVPFELLN